jgi:large subunit ribosomal protein L7/L12
MTEEKKEEKIEVPEKFKKIVEEIEKMSVLDLAELVKILEKKFGVSAAPQVVAAPTGAPAAPSSSCCRGKISFHGGFNLSRSKEN